MRERKPIRFIAVLPSAVTLLNGFFGVSAILVASIGQSMYNHFPLLSRVELSYPAVAAWMIILSMVADALDGSVARASGSSSAFGAQLDSLCDAVSFGVAPALLSYKLFSDELAQLGGDSSGYSNMAGRLVLFCAVFYALCALVRLARFNVETDADETSHMSFAGLPSPAAAGLVISLVIFREQFSSISIIRMSIAGTALSDALRGVTLWCIPAALLLTGTLMVSRVVYPHIVNHMLRRRKPFIVLALTMFIGLFAIWNIHISLLLGFLVFCFSGLVRKLVMIIRGRRKVKVVRKL